MKIEDLAVYNISHISVYNILYIVYIVLYPIYIPLLEKPSPRFCN